MMAVHMSDIYETLGVPAIITISGVPSDIYVRCLDSFHIETVSFAKFKALASDVEGIDKGDTLEVDGATYTIHSLKPSEDRQEIYIGVDDD